MSVLSSSHSMSARRRPLLATASKFLLGTVMLLGAATAGRAATESFSISFPGPAGTGYQTTDWNTTLAVSKFDPSLGVLQSITYILTGRVQGTAAVESRDNSAVTVTTQLSALITLDRPDNSALVTTLPVVNTSTPVTAYDGVLDFGGTSGRTFSGEQNTLVNTVSNDTGASDLALFTGSSGAPGTISLPTTAAGKSNAGGSGNLISQFTTTAGADFTVTYNYTPAPEPGTYALMLGGLGALIGVQRLRRRR